MEDLKEELRRILTTTPTSRERLCAELGCTDGQLRSAVRELRESGTIICSSNKTRGYWFGDRQDATRTAAELRAKAFTLLREAARIDGKELDGQIEVPAGEGFQDKIEAEPDPGLLTRETSDGQITINF